MSARLPGVQEEMNPASRLTRIRCSYLCTVASLHALLRRRDAQVWAAARGPVKKPADSTTPALHFSALKTTPYSTHSDSTLCTTELFIQTFDRWFVVWEIGCGRRCTLCRALGGDLALRAAAALGLG